MVQHIMDVLEGLFSFYKNIHSSSVSESCTSTAESITHSLLESSSCARIVNPRKLVKGWREDDENVQEIGSKSELEQYLDSPTESESDSFDVLRWWNDKKSIYKILSFMAKDILAIPVSTVTSESAFSTSGRVLDQFRRSLIPKFVEALICAQDWLRSSPTPITIEQ
ncbi:hypothetical protein CDL15_Pgr011750 [Punica granatum]|uniref:HAT C-terminal dimerisation domain-containing protein n=1 Tax=Punica granatum TaxID=22663 RepID=A0A218XE36_PUNGR|nr:hypothetical protein CDL15_Pgr011750 [Punica granatum]